MASKALVFLENPFQKVRMQSNTSRWFLDNHLGLARPTRKLHHLWPVHSCAAVICPCDMSCACAGDLRRQAAFRASSMVISLTAWRSATWWQCTCMVSTD